MTEFFPPVTKQSDKFSLRRKGPIAAPPAGPRRALILGIYHESEPAVLCPGGVHGPVPGGEGLPQEQLEHTGWVPRLRVPH